MKCITCTTNEATGLIIPKAGGKSYPFCKLCADRGLYNKSVFDYRPDGYDNKTYVVEAGLYPEDMEMLYAGQSLDVATQHAVDADDDSPVRVHIWEGGEHLISLQWDGSEWKPIDSQFGDNNEWIPTGERDPADEKA